MPSSARATIGQKVTSIVMLTSSLVLVLTLATSVVIQTATFRASMTDKLVTLAEVLSANTREALAFRQGWRAQRLIETVAAEPTIEVAAIFNAQHHPVVQFLNRNQTSFASEMERGIFQRQQLLQAGSSGRTLSLYRGRSLTVYAPVIHEGELLGGIYLQASQLPLLRNLLWVALAALLLLGLTLMLAYGLTLRLKRLITWPLHQLVDQMQRISSNPAAAPAQATATEQVTPIGDVREIRALQESFGQMLDQIRRHEAALQAHSSSLEEQVRRRTRDLLESNRSLQDTCQQLDLARDQALQASAAKSRFLANMSHEIRTPMIGVLGMAELLLQARLLPAELELARTIHSSGETLLALLNDLLDSAKIEAGKLELEQQPFRPVEVIEQACALLAESAFAKGLELTIQCQPDVPVELRGDSARLRQILLNLLSNAIKFTAEGSILVSLNCHKQQPDRAWLQLQVRDSGIGLSDSAKQTIFQPFTQADSSTSRQYGGTGLGLTIVKQLCELMGGSITVVDNVPRGSLFSLHLPFDRTNEQRDLAACWRACLPPLPAARQLILASPFSELRAVLRLHLASHCEGSHSVCSTAELLTLLSDGGPGDAPGLLLLDSALTDDLAGLLHQLAEQPGHDRWQRILIVPPRQQLSTTGCAELGIAQQLTKPVGCKNLCQLLCPAPASACASAAPEPDTPVAPAAAASQYHILLAEDNPTNQRLVQLIVEGAGYRLSIAGNGADALALLERDHFDLILMDCQMPGTDGYSATRQLRRQGYQLPVIALTAHAGNEEILLCQQAGMNDHLCKPFRRQQLLDLLIRYLAASSGAGTRKEGPC